jgi:peptide/nickel transport system substrate-binding protein
VISGAGIRTFLFADMRGYTRFTQQHGDAAASALAGRFADLAGEVVPHFEGELLELRGDEALCVFRSARQALQAAVELQRRLRTVADDQPALPLGVGMGLDAGEAVPTHGGYRGASLNLAARLCGLAKPGEILASETVIGLASRVDGMRYLEGRSARFKGIARPVRYVVVEPEQPLPAVPRGSSDKARDSRRLIWAVVAAIALVVFAAVGVAAIAGLGSSAAPKLSADQVGAVKPGATGLSVRATVGSRPQSIAVGGGGVWVANAGDGTVSRISPVSGAVVDTIQVGGEPTAVAASSDGVFVVDAASSRLLVISPSQTDPVSTVARTGNGADAIAVSSGTVWVANGFDGTVSKVSARTGRTETIPVGVSPTGIAVGAGGVWVASQTSGVVIHLDSAGHFVSRIAVGTSPVSITANAEGVWIADDQDGTLWKIGPQSDTALPIAHIGRPLTAVSTFNGAVWVADQSGVLTPINVSNGHVEQSVSVGGSPAALAGGQRLWVSSLSPPSSHRGGTLQVVEDFCPKCNQGHLTSLDPDSTEWYSELSVVINVYDGLVAYRRLGGIAGAQLVPDLAQSLPTTSGDGRIITFHLRAGIRYSNGVLVRPEDFRRGMERAFKLQNGLITSSGYYADLIGANRCLAHPATCDLSAGITTSDAADTVTFHLTRPDPTFVYKLALVTDVAAPPSAPNHDDGHRPFPGTGPYMISRWDGETAVLVRNPHFHQWSAAAQPDGFPDRIVIHSGVVRHQLVPHLWPDYLRGRYDLLVGQTPTSRESKLLLRTPNWVHSSAWGFLGYFILNNRIPPFSDLRVRRAVSFAVDRRQASHAWLGNAKDYDVSCQIIPPDFPGYTPYCPYTQHPDSQGAYHGPNITQARRLLAHTGTQGERVDIVYGTPVTYGAINYFVALLNRLGFHAKAHLYTWKGTANGGLFGWGADWPSPSAFFDPLLGCRMPYNLGGYCSRKLDAAVKRAEQLDLTNPSQSQLLWRTLDRQTTNQAPWITLNNGRQTDLTSQRVGNYQYNPHYGPLIDQMWVK